MASKVRDKVKAAGAPAMNNDDGSAESKWREGPGASRVPGFFPGDQEDYNTLPPGSSDQPQRRKKIKELV